MEVSGELVTRAMALNPLEVDPFHRGCIADVYIRICNSSNRTVLWLGVSTARGVLKGHSIRKVEKHCSRRADPFPP